MVDTTVCPLTKYGSKEKMITLLVNIINDNPSIRSSAPSRIDVPGTSGACCFLKDYLLNVRLDFNCDIFQLATDKFQIPTTTRRLTRATKSAGSKTSVV